MKVSVLIEKLKQVDQNLTVYVMNEDQDGTELHPVKQLSIREELGDHDETGIVIENIYDNSQFFLKKRGEG